MVNFYFYIFYDFEFVCLSFIFNIGYGKFVSSKKLFNGL